MHAKELNKNKKFYFTRLRLGLLRLEEDKDDTLELQ